MNAPVVFVSAKLSTTDIPRLTADQLAMAQQTLVALGYVHAEREDLPIFEMTAQGPVSKGGTPLVRVGFFNSSRTDAFIFDQYGFEFRSTDYINFKVFSDRISEVMNSIVGVLGFLSFPEVQQMDLSYVDLIAAGPDRVLKDYFSNKNVLPLSAVQYPASDDRQFGQYQVTRVVDSESRLSISLEQFPLSQGARFKLVPDMFSENNNDFCNTIQIPEAFSKTKAEGSHYAILFMHGTCKTSGSIKSEEWKAVLAVMHDVVSDQFVSLLDRSVCDVEWKFEKQDLGD